MASATAGSGVAAAPETTVTLISSDKQKFIVERRVALVSGLIRTMLSNSSFAEGSASGGGEITFPEISGAVLEKCVSYMHYKTKYTNSRTPIPEFPIPVEIALDVLAGECDKKISRACGKEKEEEGPAGKREATGSKVIRPRQQLSPCRFPHVIFPSLFAASNYLDL